MIVVGKETRTVNIEINNNEQASVVKRCSLEALKCGLRERVEESILNEFNKDRLLDEKAEWIGEDAVGTLCFMREEDHYHGTPRTKIFSPLSKKDIDKLEILSKMLSVLS